MMHEDVPNTRLFISPDDMPGAGSSSNPLTSTKDTQARGVLPRKAFQVWNNVVCGKGYHLRLTLRQSEFPQAGGNAHSTSYSADGDSGVADTPVSVPTESSRPSVQRSGQDSMAIASVPGPDSANLSSTNTFGTARWSSKNQGVDLLS